MKRLLIAFYDAATNKQISSFREALDAIKQGSLAIEWDLR